MAHINVFIGKHLKLLDESYIFIKPNFKQMDKETAHQLYDELMNKNKGQYTSAEMVIILTSQYYNIADIEKLIPELDPNEYDIGNMQHELLSICESFQKNLTSLNENFTWKNREVQALTVERVKKSCLKYLQR